MSPSDIEPPSGTTPEDALTTAVSSAAFMIATIAPSLAVDVPTATAILAGALATAGAMSGSDKGPHDKPSNGECSLLGPFALIVQGALGGCALLALVYKRWRERPQRPLKIWTFDVSKQVVGSVLVHIANLLMSMLSSGQFSIKLDPNTISTRDVDAQGNYKPNPCSFYLLNLAIDTTIGIPILIILLRILTALFRMTPFGNPPESIQSGNYGTPPRYGWWIKQSFIYFIGLMGMKFCVLLIFLLLPWISRVGDWALRWTEGNEELQVFFVMLFFPVIMNATQYYIIDSFIKNQKPGEAEVLPEDDGDSYDGTDSGHFEDPHSGSTRDVHSEDEDEALTAKETLVKSKTKSAGRSGRKTGSSDPHHYDPKFDGDSSPTVVGSSSSERGKLLAPEEFESEDELKPVDR